MTDEVIIYSDGGADPNPGVVVLREPLDEARRARQFGAGGEVPQLFQHQAKQLHVPLLCRQRLQLGHRR